MVLQLNNRKGGWNMDIKKLKNNRQFYDSLKFIDDKKVELSIKEDPEFNIHIWEGYFDDIFEKPIFNGKVWVGFTRDYQELKGGWEKKARLKISTNTYGICFGIKAESMMFRGKEPPKYLSSSLTFSPTQSRQVKRLLWMYSNQRRKGRASNRLTFFCGLTTNFKYHLKKYG